MHIVLDCIFQNKIYSNQQNGMESVKKKKKKTWLAVRVLSVATVGSVEIDGFISFFGNSRCCKL
jgi:hypothetical protein